MRLLRTFDRDDNELLFVAVTAFTVGTAMIAVDSGSRELSLVVFGNVRF